MWRPRVYAVSAAGAADRAQVRIAGGHRKGRRRQSPSRPCVSQEPYTCALVSCRAIPMVPCPSNAAPTCWRPRSASPLPCRALFRAAVFTRPPGPAVAAGCGSGRRCQGHEADAGAGKSPRRACDARDHEGRPRASRAVCCMPAGQVCCLSAHDGWALSPLRRCATVSHGTPAAPPTVGLCVWRLYAMCSWSSLLTATRYSDLFSSSWTGMCERGSGWMPGFGFGAGGGVGLLG